MSHRHEGAPGHAHGWGWVGLTTSGPTDPRLPHRHFVLLGIESDAVPDGAEAGGIVESGCVGPTADVLVPDGTADDPADGPAILDLAVVPPSPTDTPHGAGVLPSIPSRLRFARNLEIPRLR